MLQEKCRVGWGFAQIGQCQFFTISFKEGFWNFHCTCLQFTQLIQVTQFNATHPTCRNIAITHVLGRLLLLNNIDVLRNFWSNHRCGTSYARRPSGSLTWMEDSYQINSGSTDKWDNYSQLFTPLLKPLWIFLTGSCEFQRNTFLPDQHLSSWRCLPRMCCLFARNCLRESLDLRTMEQVLWIH